MSDAQPALRAQTRRAWRITLVATGVAAAVFLIVRALPLSGGSLHYTDFHAGGRAFLEFCEPGGSRFAAVDRVASPVRLDLRPETPPRIGAATRIVATLSTLAGKPVAEADLLVAHAHKLHLLIVDASLDDYQHLHPQATVEAGQFAFTFTPRRGGRYRIFADFVPGATGRGLYSVADLAVEGPEIPFRAQNMSLRRPDQAASVGEFQIQLIPERAPVRIREATSLTLRVRRIGGGPVVLEEIMGARAHVVAFDAARSGFAHLHPTEGAGEDLQFLLGLDDPGLYRLWAQVRVDGAEVFAPFDLEVVP